MPELNADVMHLLLEYFDAQTWAKLAQVCTTWKALAYRPTVWQALEWKPRPGYEDLFLQKVPANARHIGEPTTLCFHAWANTTLFQEEFHRIPKQIVYETDPANKHSALERYWKTHRKPCVHAHHHVWTDVLRARGHIQTMTKPELQRLYFRIVDDPTPPTCETNPYRLFLLHQSQDCGNSVFLQWTCPLAHGNAHTTAHPKVWETDIVQNLRAKVVEEKCKLKDLGVKHRQASMQTYEQSMYALRTYTSNHFNNNAHQYKRRSKEMLDAVAFSA